MSENTIKKTSLLTRFNLLLIIFYVISLLITAPIVYQVTKSQTFENANKELSLLVDMVKSLRKYIAEDVRPELMSKGIFHAPAVSSTVATGLVAKRFLAKQPDYYIKIASDNPLNPKNKPEALEKFLLEKFRKNSVLESVIERGMINGKEYLVSSRPSKTKKGCLRCHGRPENAPESITKKYGTKSGFYYPANRSVVGVSVVGVPIGQIKSIAINRSLQVMGIITLIFSLLFISANILIRRTIITPVIELTEIAKEISKGKLKVQINLTRKDEIGELGRSFELMRRSLVAMLTRVRGK